MLGLIGNIGGVLELLIMIFGIVMFPFSYHKFVLNSIKTFFLARTQDNNLFRHKPKKGQTI